MTEKDLLEQIKQSAQNITPPESLNPEEIEQMLREQKEPSENQSDSLAKITADRDHAREKITADQNRPGKKISVYRLGGLAAAFVLAIAGAWTAGRYSVSGSTYASDQAVPKTVSESPETAVTLSESEGLTDSSISQEDSASSADADVSADTDVSADVSASANADTSAITGTLQEKSSAAEDTEEDALITEPLTTADSYEAIYDTLYQKFVKDSGYYANDILYAATDTMELAVEESMDAGQMAKTSLASESASEGGYSTTNVQEIGVDEADIVKTDGSFIYVLKRSGTLLILSAKDKAAEITASIEIPAGQTAHEMYVDGDRLSFITSEYYTEMDDSRENVIASRSGTRTTLYTYNIADRKNPVLSGAVTQDGSYSQSRKNGDYLYLFTRFSPIIAETYEESSIVPGTSSGEVSASAIYLPENLNNSTYLVVSSVDIHNPGETIDQKAVVSVASTFYASTENIYIANENWDGANTRTELLKLHYENGIISGAAAGSLEGYLNDSFSLNESQGYLRAVTTSYDENYTETSGLYILDENLRLTGAIRDLAPGETIRSARFVEDTAYFVTFRQTDPLFSVDVSDPSSPRLLGDLKITGFSSYLHFYGENLLLGLGYEADPETGIQTGLKLSMFDISNPSDVTEISKFVLSGITWCDALNNYKTILIDPEKNIFGFTCDNRYLVFSYDDEKGFTCEFIYDFYNDMLNGCSISGARDTRGLYIDDTLYLVSPDVVNSFDMSDGYRKINQTLLP